MIAQVYVLLDSVPCLFSKPTVGKISAALENSITLPTGDSRTFLKHWGVLLSVE